MLPTTLVSLSARPIDLLLTEPFNIATGGQAVATNVIVTVTLADGTTGLGEAAPFEAVSGETQAGSLRSIEQAAAGLIGIDARAYRLVAAQLAEAIFGEPAARCAIEMALLDALARHYR